MKTLTVYCDKDLVFRWNEWPVEPDEVDGAGDFEGKWDNYEHAIEVAKRESIPFDTQNDVKTLAYMHLYHSGKTLDHITDYKFQPDTFYSFPFEGEVKMSCNRDCPEVEYGACFHPSNCCKLARLIPESKEESYEEINKEIEQILFKEDNVDEIIKQLNKRFKITRKHP